ncbi:hypothetical protein GCM10029964_056400 [Kibdelosporangium lantanae]
MPLDLHGPLPKALPGVRERRQAQVRSRHEEGRVVAKDSNDVRAVARKRLEERRGFVPHLIIFVLVNAGLIAIWVATSPDVFFWPVFPLVFWGAGVVMHAWNAFFSRPITEADVDREVERLDALTDGPNTD